MNLHFITNMMKTRVKALITTPSSNLAVVAQLTLFLKKCKYTATINTRYVRLLVVDLCLDPDV